MFPVYYVFFFFSLHMTSSVRIFIITFLKGTHILDTWVGNKLKFPHRVLCFTDWLATNENSIGVYFGF